MDSGQKATVFFYSNFKICSQIFIKYGTHP